MTGLGGPDPVAGGNDVAVVRGHESRTAPRDFGLAIEDGEDCRRRARRALRDDKPDADHEDHGDGERDVPVARERLQASSLTHGRSRLLGEL